MHRKIQTNINIFIVGMLLGSALFTGCSGIKATQRLVNLQHDEIIKILSETFDEDFPLPIVNPFYISDEMQLFVDSTVRLYHSRENRFNSLVDSIFYSKNPIIYNENLTNSAIETFNTREGNCLSLTNMFIGLSRYAGLETFFIEVLDHVAWTSEGDLIVNNGHIIAGMNIYRVKARGTAASGYMTVDFYPSRPKSYRHLQPIDDLKAITYFYNNLGVNLIKKDEIDNAIILFTNILRLNRSLDKVYNNLGVCYSKKKLYEKAFETYEKGFEYNDKNISILSNLVFLSEHLGRIESYEYYKGRLDEIRNTNPYFFIQLANQSLLKADNDGFLANIRTAEKLDPAIPDIHLLYIKYYISIKRFDLAKKSLQKAETLKLDQETSQLFHKKIDYFMTH